MRRSGCPERRRAAADRAAFFGQKVGDVHDGRRKKISQAAHVEDVLNGRASAAHHRQQSLRKSRLLASQFHENIEVIAVRHFEHPDRIAEICACLGECG